AATGLPAGIPLRGHHSWVWSVAYSADGKRIVSGFIDHTIRIWDAATGPSIATLHGHTNRVYSVVFSPDGTQLASASPDGTLRIWDA
ncbi:WD40 repeat-like protein, partial [Exidia glandulosa HHB12029]